jgi:hypothetical protein
MANGTAPVILRSLVWERMGLFGNRPGVLTLADGALSFVTDEGTGFHCPVSKLSRIEWPWYSFNCGLNLRVEAVKYRFSFGPPNGAAAAYNVVEAAAGLSEIGGGMRAGKVWRLELARQVGRRREPVVHLHSSLKFP